MVILEGRMWHIHTVMINSDFLQNRMNHLEKKYWFKIQYLSVQQFLSPKYSQVKLWWGVVFFTNIIFSIRTISILIIFIPEKLVRFYHQ